MAFASAVAALCLWPGLCGGSGSGEEAARLARAAASLQGEAGPPRMILVGDSHLEGPFGRALRETLAGIYAGWRLEVYASCGASPQWFLPDEIVDGRRTNPASGHTSACGTWFRRYEGSPPAPVDVTTPAPTPLIADLLKTRPAVVVVELGTNMADWKRGGLGDMAPASRLASLIRDSGARCLWIGPPDERGRLTEAAAAAQVAALNAALRSAVGGDCAYLESRTRYEGSDPERIHYSAGPARAWASQAARAVQSALAAP